MAAPTACRASEPLLTTAPFAGGMGTFVADFTRLALAPIWPRPTLTPRLRDVYSPQNHAWNITRYFIEEFQFETHGQNMRQVQRTEGIWDKVHTCIFSEGQ